MLTKLNSRTLTNMYGGNSGTCKFIMEGANCYSCRYPNGKWDYIVTKGIFEATTNTITTGWAKSLGQGYYLPGYRG